MLGEEGVTDVGCSEWGVGVQVRCWGFGRGLSWEWSQRCGVESGGGGRAVVVTNRNSVLAWLFLTDLHLE